ncbi:MAG: RNA polymerase sigma factor [Planctomycetota bacterium]
MTAMFDATDSSIFDTPARAPKRRTSSKKRVVGSRDDIDPGLDPEAARDAALVHAANSGDRKALEELLGRYSDRVFGVCLRMCGSRDSAEDLAQETLVRVIQGLSKFGHRSKVSTWIIRIAMNTCLTNRRRMRLRRHASLDAPAGDGGESLVSLQQDAAEPDAHERVSGQRERARLHAAMCRIKPEQRAIIILRDVHGLDYAAIADVLDIAGGTVKSRLFRARSALRDEIERLERSG